MDILKSLQKHIFKFLDCSLAAYFLLGETGGSKKKEQHISDYLHKDKESLLGQLSKLDRVIL